jgi:hypothetical protein
MKKQLLFIAICLFTVINSMDAQFVASPYSVVQGQLKTTTDNNDLVKLGYCDDDIASAIGVGSVATLSAAIQVPASKYSAYAGGTIKSIKIGLTQNCTNVSVWIKSSLTGSNLYSQTLGTVPTGWKEVELTESYVIPEGDFFIGYTATGKGQIGFSGDSFYEAAWLSTGGNNWENYLDQGWGSLCIQAFIDLGDKTILDMGIESLKRAYANIGEDFTIPGLFRNNSTETITSFKLSYEIGEVASDVTLTDIAIQPHTFFKLDVPIDAIDVQGEYTVTLAILEVNEQEDSYVSNNSEETTVEILKNTFPKKVVVEEGTGAWCQWCPRGTVGMAMMKEKYPDTFIGIAVHNGDNMAVTDYANSLARFFTGYPMCVVDRKAELAGDPYYDIEDFYNSERAIPTTVKVELTEAFFSSLTKIDLTTVTTFGYSSDNVNYKLAYVLIENGVTGATQQNAYAGGANGPMGGFENRPSQITDMVYEDVARGIYSGYNGINNSIPTSVEELVPNDHSYTLTIPNNIQHNDNLEVAVLLLNSAGEIVNADKIVVNNDLRVNEKFPADKSEDVELDTDIYVSFNYDFTLLSTTGITINGEPAEVSKSKEKLYINHDILDYSTEYNIIIPAGTIEDISEDIEWQFTTMDEVKINSVNKFAKVYPTLSNGNVTINTESNATVKVMDISGRSLDTYKSTGILNVGLNYANGVYFIHIENNGNNSVHKVILKR